MQDQYLKSQLNFYMLPMDDPKTKLRKVIQVTIASKNKILRSKLQKTVQHLNSEKYKTLLKVIKEDLHK